jgi:hypothetical protein
MTTIDGVASVRPTVPRAAAWSTASARAHVPLRDHRRNCDHTRVQGPKVSGRNRHWHPVWAMYSIASTTVRRSPACFRPRLLAGLNTGSSKAHWSSVRSLAYAMPATVLILGTAAVT